MLISMTPMAANWLTDMSWVPGLRNDVLTPIFEFFTWAGYHYFYMAFLPLALWLWNKHIMFRTAILVAITGLLNSWLKDFWQNPRPDPIYRMDGGIGDSFGMPSGHVQISVTLWMWLAYEINKKWMWALATIMVVGIALSRIYLGVHDIEDVLMGLFLAIVGLLVAGLFVKKVAPKITKLPLIVVLAVLIALEFIIFKFWPIERGPGPVIAIGAFILTWIIGYYIDRDYLRYTPPQGLTKKVVGAVIGVLGFIVLMKATSTLFDTIGFEGQSAIYISSLIMGIYMSVVGLALLQLVKLSGKTTQENGTSIFD